MATLFNFGMVIFVPQLFLFGFWSMGKIIALKEGLGSYNTSIAAWL